MTICLDMKKDKKGETIKKMISIQIGFYANNSQRPILKEIGLILNNKIREWINIRSTISRYLPTVEHQLT